MLRRGAARSEPERYCQFAVVNVSRVESIAVIGICSIAADCSRHRKYNLYGQLIQRQGR